MTTTYSFLSSAILERVLYYLSIELSRKFVTAFGHLATVPLERGRFFRQPLQYLQSSVLLYRRSAQTPDRKRVFCQSQRGKANLHSNLQKVWGSP